MISEGSVTTFGSNFYKYVATYSQGAKACFFVCPICTIPHATVKAARGWSALQVEAASGLLLLLFLVVLGVEALHQEHAQWRRRNGGGADPIAVVNARRAQPQPETAKSKPLDAKKRCSRAWPLEGAKNAGAPAATEGAP